MLRLGGRQPKCGSSGEQPAGQPHRTESRAERLIRCDYDLSDSELIWSDNSLTACFEFDSLIASMIA